LMRRGQGGKSAKSRSRGGETVQKKGGEKDLRLNEDRKTRKKKTSERVPGSSWEKMKNWGEKKSVYFREKGCPLKEGGREVPNCDPP